MTTILLLLLAYCCSVLFAWCFRAMKHLGLIVFSLLMIMWVSWERIFSFVLFFFWQGGEWVVGKFHINLVGSKQFFHILKGFLNKCSNLYVTNFNLLLDLKCFGEFFVLNFWMCALNGPFWTGLTESDNPWTCCGRIIDSECYGVVCSVWGAERIMRLYHSINTEWHHGAHKRAVVSSST